MLLTACDAHSAEAEAAEKRYDIVSVEGTLGETCDQAIQVRDAWLKANDREKYKTWSSTADTYCLSAEVHGKTMPADLKKRDAMQAAATSRNLEAQADALEAAGAAVEAAGNAVHDPVAGDEPVTDDPGEYVVAEGDDGMAEMNQESSRGE
jgi:hypothetical protein